MVVALPLWSCEFIADPKIERQLLVDFKIVLQIPEVHSLAQMRNRIVVLFIMIPQAEHEIGKAVQLLARSIQCFPGAFVKKPV